MLKLLFCLRNNTKGFISYSVSSTFKHTNILYWFLFFQWKSLPFFNFIPKSLKCKPFKLLKFKNYGHYSFPGKQLHSFFTETFQLFKLHNSPNAKIATLYDFTWAKMMMMKLSDTHQHHNTPQERKNGIRVNLQNMVQQWEEKNWARGGGWGFWENEKYKAMRGKKHIRFFGAFFYCRWLFFCL